MGIFDFFSGGLATFAIVGMVVFVLFILLRMWRSFTGYGRSMVGLAEKGLGGAVGVWKTSKELATSLEKERMGNQRQSNLDKKGSDLDNSIGSIVNNAQSSDSFGPEAQQRLDSLIKERERVLNEQLQAGKALENELNSDASIIKKEGRAANKVAKSEKREGTKILKVAEQVKKETGQDLQGVAQAEQASQEIVKNETQVKAINGELTQIGKKLLERQRLKVKNIKFQKTKIRNLKRVSRKSGVPIQKLPQFKQILAELNNSKQAVSASANATNQLLRKKSDLVTSLDSLNTTIVQKAQVVEKFVKSTTKVINTFTAKGKISENTKKLVTGRK
jgi:hypothetical protein